MPYGWENLPSASPYGSDWALGAELGSQGVIFVGEIPIGEVPRLIEEGWELVGQPLPNIPQVFAPPDIPASGDYEGFGDDIAREAPPEPRVPPFREPPILEGEIVGDAIGDIVGAIGEAAGRVLGGPVAVGVTEILRPGELGPGDLTSGGELIQMPAPDIPEPRVDLPTGGPTFPEPAPPTLDFPMDPPDVVVVTAPAPSAPRTPRPNPNLSPWQFDRPITLPRLHPRRRTVPAPQQLGVPDQWPLPNTPPVPSAAGQPTTLPTLPGLNVPTMPPLPTQLPSPQPLPMPSPAATALPSVPSSPIGSSTDAAQQCETPQERKKRQQKKRDNCRKLVRIRVRAHYKRVCLSDAIEHEAKRYRKKLVRKYITKPAGKIGRDAADWLLKKTGLTPYAEQAKDVKKRVSDLTKRQKRYYYEIPGTHVSIDPVNLIPKGKP